MAFSGGTFTFTSNSFAPTPTTATTISSTAAASTWSEIATALSLCVLKDGTQTLTANIPMSSFILTGLGAGSASGHSVRYEQVLGVVTTAGDTIYATAAGTLARLAIGAANTRLAVNAGATAPTWVADTQNTVIDAKGDLLGGTAADTVARLAVGANDTVLTADSAQATGLKWALPAQVATQAEQETGTSTTVYVSPGRQHFHLSALKCWGNCGVAGDLNSPSYNITSVGDTGTGIATVTIATDFSTAVYSVLATAISDFTTLNNGTLQGVDTLAAGSFIMRCISNANPPVAADPGVGYTFAAAGDLA